MKNKLSYFVAAAMLLTCACQSNEKKSAESAGSFEKGTFGYDLQFLQKHDSIIVLKSSDGLSQIAISPKYQGKVFTSTASGDTGRSFGWINYKTFDAKIDEHMNAYGGEDRLWLGPEGGKYALFFKPGTKMEFANWHTPAPIDHQEWSLVSKTDSQVYLSKGMTLQNYTGSTLKMNVGRIITLLERSAIQKEIGVDLDNGVKAVGIKTDNRIINAGTEEWTAKTGVPCLWNLDMFTPSPGVVVVIPYEEKVSGKVATTDYFGQIPPDRVTYKNGHLFFKADGKSRGKLGMPAIRTKAVAGSYDAVNNVLTLALFDVDSKATYLNQEWTPDKDPLTGDAVNSYNDGPLADGTQMGPFYEIESVSPGAFLKPGEKLAHRHCIYHFTGNKTGLDKIAVKVLGVALNDIQAAFSAR